jgi:hypothetical protein
VNEAAARIDQIDLANMTSMDYGETALTQSKKYRYSHIESALQKAGARE